MQLLIAKGANVDQKDNFGATPLMYASQGGICSLMETLIRDGKANLEKTDKFNNNALHYAIAFNQIAASLLRMDLRKDLLLPTLTAISSNDRLECATNSSKPILYNKSAATRL